MAEYNPFDADADPFRPPKISVVVGCLHCQETYDSYRIEWRIETTVDGSQHGFWCCPIEGCDGRGFGFDIFPVDPDYRNENGEKMWVDDDGDDEEFDDPDADDGRNGERRNSEDDEPLPW